MGGSLPPVVGQAFSSAIGRDIRRMAFAQDISQQVCFTQGIAVGSATGLSGQNITGSTLSETSATYRNYFKTLKNYAVNDLRFTFANAYVIFDDLGEKANPNSITVKHYLEYPLNTLTPIYYNGGTVQTNTIPGGHVVTTDPVHGFQIPADTAFYLRTYVTAASGGWPIYQGGLTGFQETYLTGVDSSSSGTLTNTFGYMFAPVQVLGTIKAHIPNVLLVGDSITYGLGDTNGTIGEVGWGQRAIKNTYGSFKVCKSSGSVNRFINSINADSRRRWFLARQAPYTHAVVLYGTNDLTASRTSTQVLADLATLYQALVDMGMAVINVTIPPHTSSTGGQWLNAADQTPTNGIFNTTHRNAINAAIRAGMTNTVGTFDLDAVVRDPASTDVWLTDGSTNKLYTNDGLHPNAAGNALIATAFASVYPNYIY